jgi:hypothetical protein
LVPIEPAPESAPDLADVPSSPLPHCCLDLQGWIQAIAGIVVALIALLTSYDHISFPAGVRLPIEQQWGVWCIVASLALVVVDAQLATGSRLRAAKDAARAADEAAEERNRAAEERERAARRAQRQDRCTLAQFEFQLDANATTRRRLVDLTALLREYGELA